MQNQAITWKALYKQFESQLDSSTLKPNEMLLDMSNIMRNYLNGNKYCSSFIANCLDSLLSTINYEYLLGMCSGLL